MKYNKVVGFLCCLNKWSSNFKFFHAKNDISVFIEIIAVWIYLVFKMIETTCLVV